MSGHKHSAHAAEPEHRPHDDDGAGRIVNPGLGGTENGRAADGEWQGDSGDQANDIRFAEESQLVSERDPDSAGAPDGAEHPGGYTGHEDMDRHGEYTDRNGYAARGHTPRRGHYTDKDVAQEHADRSAGSYTNHDQTS